MAKRSARRNRETLRHGFKYRQIRNPYSPIEVVDDEALDRIHDASMQILETTGMRILDPVTRSILKAGGFSVDEGEQIVRFDRARIAELVAQAPSVVTVRGSDPSKRVSIGDGNIAFSAVGGPPFAADLDGGRRYGSYDDLCKFIKLVHMLDVIHIEGGGEVEPMDLPVSTRHLDLYHACCTLTDKPWQPLAVGTTRAEDALAMAKIRLGENDEQLASDPVFFVNTNTNTPLVLDAEIAEGILVFARAGQPVCVTPFALSGAMAPATMAGALALQNAETLAACALVQIVRPGCPYIYGSFASNVDMKTGSPAFGTPEYALAAQASGQLARRYGLPWRSSNVNAAKSPDAQSAYESEMSLWGAITGHAGVVNHCAGWLEGGLVASFEKLIIDAEMLQMMAVWTEGMSCSDDDIGLAAVKEVGPGGHFFGTQHTLERYQDAFYSPLVSDWSNFEMWTENGSEDTAVRANRLWKQLVAEHERPPLDPAVDEALNDYVAVRKAEIGTPSA